PDDPLSGDGRRAPPDPSRLDTKTARSRMTPAGSVGRDDRLRLFLALQPDSTTLDVLERWPPQPIRGGRIAPRDHLHVTLAFLGGRPASELEEIVGALRKAVAPARRIALEPTR